MKYLTTAKRLLTALFLLLSTSLSTSTELPIRKTLSCDEVRMFVRTYGEEEALRRASLMGLSKKTVDYIIRTCFGREASKESK